MKTELQRLFFEEVQKNFSFLQPKFRGPFPRLDIRTGVFTVVFIGTNLAVEFILDERDEDIACKISRVINGQPTPYYAVDPQGKLVRGELSNLLLAHGIQDKVFTPVAGLSLRERIPITLGDYVRMLQKYGQKVLDDDPEFLNVQRRRW